MYDSPRRWTRRRTLFVAAAVTLAGAAAVAARVLRAPPLDAQQAAMQPALQAPLPPLPPLPAAPPSGALPSPSGPARAAAAYRAPTLALAQPQPSDASGASGALVVPQARPAVVLRFARGEPDDPVDARSLRVVVDGVDRTGLFQTADSIAWGALAPDGSAAPGPHRLDATLCSVRGACGTVTAVVTVAPGAASAPADTARRWPARRKGLVEALVQAIRSLFGD